MPAASCRGSEEGSWLLVLLVVRQSPGAKFRGGWYGNGNSNEKSPGIRPSGCYPGVADSAKVVSQSVPRPAQAVVLFAPVTALIL
jgi:hypothetical protein